MVLNSRIVQTQNRPGSPAPREPRCGPVNYSGICISCKLYSRITSNTICDACSASKWQGRPPSADSIIWRYQQL